MKGAAPDRQCTGDGFGWLGLGHSSHVGAVVIRGQGAYPG